MDFGTFLKNELLDHAFNDDQWTLPTLGSVWLALFTDATTDAGGGTEVTGGAYVRKLVDSDPVNQWAVPAAGVTSNINDEVFVTASGAAWGLITNLAIIIASTGTNFMVHGTLVTSRQINDGDTFEFSTGDLTITFD